MAAVVVSDIRVSCRRPHLAGEGTGNPRGFRVVETLFLHGALLPCYDDEQRRAPG